MHIEQRSFSLEGVFSASRIESTPIFIEQNTDISLVVETDYIPIELSLEPGVPIQTVADSAVPTSNNKELVQEQASRFNFRNLDFTAVREKVQLVVAALEGDTNKIEELQHLANKSTDIFSHLTDRLITQYETVQQGFSSLMDRAYETMIACCPAELHSSIDSIFGRSIFDRSNRLVTETGALNSSSSQFVTETHDHCDCPLRSVKDGKCENCGGVVH